MKSKNSLLREKQLRLIEMAVDRCILNLTALDSPHVYRIAASLSDLFETKRRVRNVRSLE